MVKYLKKIIFLLSIIILSTLLTSCIRGQELNTLGIVVTTGVDIEGDKIIVTNEIINPGSGTPGKMDENREETLFVQGIGDTVTEAIANMTLTFDRRPYYSHNHVIILGEDFVKRGIGGDIDVLTRSNRQREAAYMLVAKNAKAYDLMGVGCRMSSSVGRSIFDKIQGDIYNGRTRSITINEFFKYYYTEGEGVTLGVVEEMEKMQVNQMKSEDSFFVLNVEGGALLKGDKLQGYFTGKEMIGFNFIVNNVANVYIPFQVEEKFEKDEDIIGNKGEFSVVRTYSNKTKTQIKLVDENLHLFINIKFRGILLEDNQGLDISQPRIKEEMEKACGEKVKTYITGVLEKSQKEFQTDTFGIGELLHRKYPSLWREVKDQWPDIYSNLDYTINVEVNINDTGFTNSPANIRKRR